MKKFLSLVLALVMTMSLVTISAGAKDFDDSADITYVEAVDVMSEVGIVDGDTAGNFNPTNGLTRGAAAKIICNLILGPTTAAELNADTNPYPDVDKDSTFAGYIAYCAKEGIVGGYADGTFKPAAPLTGYAFMKMLLGALGYDAAVEGYTGANWSINVAKQAIGIGLNAGLVSDFNGSDFVTREEAMLYAFNTLQATMVDYDTTITIGDITVAGSNEYDVANNSRNETLVDDNKMQFAEKYFTKLTTEPAEDAFGRPCTTWIYNKEEIGTYVDYTEIVAEYTTTVTGKELYDVIGKTAMEYDLYAYVDGVENDLYNEISKNNKGDIDETGNGALTQVFVDVENEDVIVTVINTYLAQATMDYNAKKDSVTFEVFPVDSSVSVSGEDFDIADVKEDDFVLVTYDESEDEIVTIKAVETIADTEITKFKAGKAGNITVDGETYNYNNVASYDAAVLAAYTGSTTGVSNLKDITYNVYLDTYGYVVGVEEVEAPDNYVFITGADDANSNLVNKTWAANAIFMDGTSKVIDVNYAKSTGLSDSELVNAWFSYTVNNDDVYTLTAVADADIYSNTTKNEVAFHHSTGTEVAEIDAKHISLGAYGSDFCYGNDASIYLLADLDEVNGKGVIKGVDEVVTGVKNAAFETYKQSEARTALKLAAGAATSSGVYALYKDNGYVIAAVVVGESGTIESNLAYVHETGATSESYDKTTKTWTWTRDVVISGEEVTLTETNDTGISALKSATMSVGNWVTVKYYADGTVKEVVDYTKNLTNTVENAVIELKKDGVELVVLDTAATAAYSLKGNTLYDETNKVLGFLVAEDVNVVLTQTNKNKTTTTFDEGISYLEATLKDLNGDTKSYTFDAIIEDGIATTVIIVDNNTDGYTPLAPDSTVPDGKATIIGNEYIVAPGVTGIAAANAVSNALKDAGYTDVNIVLDASGAITKVEAKINGITVPFSANTTALTAPGTWFVVFDKRATDSKMSFDIKVAVDSVDAGAVTVVLYDGSEVLASTTKIAGATAKNGFINFTCPFYAGEHEPDNWTAGHQMLGDELLKADNVELYLNGVLVASKSF